MRLLLSTFLLLFSSTVLCQRCPTDWLEGQVDTTKCFYFSAVDDTKNFDDAEAFCQSRFGHLASISSGFEASFLRDHATANTFWVGARRNSSDSPFIWTDGRPFGNYTNWAGSQPDTTNNCVVVNKQTGKWSTSDCSGANVYVCSSSKFYRDCLDLQQSGVSTSDIYPVLTNDNQVLQVYCDMETFGGGWTLIQRRLDNSIPFWNATWDEYKNGFGSGLDTKSNFWLGNDAIHFLSTADPNVTLRVELVGDRGANVTDTSTFWFQHYDFYIDDEAHNYTLHVALDWQSMIGNASTAWYDITCSDNVAFSTVDRILDPEPKCVTKYHLGGWWLHYCAMASLNGEYDPEVYHDAYGFMWILNGYEDIINPITSAMMIRSNR